MWENGNFRRSKESNLRIRTGLAAILLGMAFLTGCAGRDSASRLFSEEPQGVNQVVPSIYHQVEGAYYLFKPYPEGNRVALGVGMPNNTSESNRIQNEVRIGVKIITIEQIAEEVVLRSPWGLQAASYQAENLAGTKQSVDPTENIRICVDALEELLRKIDDATVMLDLTDNYGAKIKAEALGPNSISGFDIPPKCLGEQRSPVTLTPSPEMLSTPTP